MYLGMGGKTPSFRIVYMVMVDHSDELVLTVKLPAVKYKEISLNCSETLLDIATEK